MKIVGKYLEKYVISEKSEFQIFSRLFLNLSIKDYKKPTKLLKEIKKEQNAFVFYDSHESQLAE